MTANAADAGAAPEDDSEDLEIGGVTHWVPRELKASIEAMAAVNPAML